MKESRIAQIGPFKVNVEAGKTYAWCRCGLSKNQPFCSGAHEGTGFKPVVFKAEATETLYLCGCKRSGNKPHCDGTHNTLKKG